MDPSGKQYNNKKSVTLVHNTMKMDIMRCLVNGNRFNTKKLGMKLNIHQSSVSHSIKEMIAEDLVIKRGDGYELTNLGNLQINLIDYLNAIHESLIQNKEFLLSHDMGDIPINYQMNLGMICNNQENVCEDISTPYRRQEYMIEQLSNSKEIRCIPTVVTTSTP